MKALGGLLHDFPLSAVCLAYRLLSQLFAGFVLNCLYYQYLLADL